MTGTLIDEIRTRRRAPLPAYAKAVRVNAQVSQDRLAQELGVHRVTVARWEDGSRRPTGALLVAYLDLLDQLSRVVAA
jgi:DNA-binding transcriptional regulator YiaG